MPKREIKKRTFQLVKGMKDILPEEQRYWRFINAQVEQLAEQYGFQRIDLPMVEETELFVRSMGQSSDVVEKEMYSFIDKGEEQISLRPEFTAGMARAYLEHGLLNSPQPVKLYTTGPCFRYDRPQAGRYRQFHQFDFEIIGDADPINDAQIIQVAYKINQLVGLPVNVQINSIGCPACRPAFEEGLKEYFKKQRSRLSELSQKRLLKNPLRILDSKEKVDQQIIENAPQQLDALCEPCKNHFIQVLEYLDELEIPYMLNPLIVRGLDYYTRTTFEIMAAEEAQVLSASVQAGPAGKNPNKDEDTFAPRQIALGGGGRYDGLLESLGGRPTPAVGFASGVERLIGQIKERDLKVPTIGQAEIFLAQLGPDARRKALRLLEELRQAGFLVAEAFAKNGLKAQLEMANRLGVKLALLLGQKEIIDGTIMIRDMDGGMQEIVNYEKIIPELKKRLAKLVVVKTQLTDEMAVKE